MPRELIVIINTKHIEFDMNEVLVMSIMDSLKHFLLLSSLPQLHANASYGLLFLVGLLTSFHCAVMCGGIVLSQTIGTGQNRKEIEKNKHGWILPSIYYNSGRVLAYTFVGGVVGGLGQAISLTGVWKGIVPIIGGLFMVIMGINLLEIFPAFRRLNIRMPLFAFRTIKGREDLKPFYVGLLTGLMPCGPLQIVQLYALGTGSIINGALSMLVFSIGTVPMLFAIGAANTLINKNKSRYILKASAVLVIVLGVIMMSRGLTLSGVRPVMPMNTAAAATEDMQLAHIEGDRQLVETSIMSDSYPPILVQKGIPVRWTIHAEEKNLNECNNAISIPEFKIEKALIAGANHLEFTPLETGTIPYSCWMGMIKSRIVVVEDLSKAGR